MLGDICNGSLTYTPKEAPTHPNDKIAIPLGNSGEIRAQTITVMLRIKRLDQRKSTKLVDMAWHDGINKNDRHIGVVTTSSIIWIL